MHITAIVGTSRYLIANIHCFMSALTSRQIFKQKGFAITKFLLLNAVLKLSNGKRCDIKQ